MNAIPLRRLFRSAVAIDVPVSVETTLADFPDVIEADAALRQVKDARRKTEAEIAEMTRPATVDEDDVDAAADALLRGDVIAADDLSHTLAALRRRLTVEQRAEQKARAEFQRVRDVRSRQLQAAIAPRYRAAVRAVAARLHELDQANLALEAVMAQLEAAGVSPIVAGFHHMTFPAAALSGGWGHGNSPAETWLGTARHLGYIGKDEALADVVREVLSR